MVAYIIETARSFPNPISGEGFTKAWKRPASSKYRSDDSYPEIGTGTDYYITFESGGPGSMPLGKDEVHYLGDDDPGCVAGCAQKGAVYRWLRGEKRDHKYTAYPQFIDRDMGCENENWKEAADGYNKEPRNGAPVFHVMHDQPKDEDGNNLSNAEALKVWFSYWPDDTLLTFGDNSDPGDFGGDEGCGKGKYQYCYTLGYAFGSRADAEAWAGAEQADNIYPLYHYRYGSMNASSGKDIDNFYTISPQNEVNLETGNGGGDGPVDCKDPRSEDYDYQGILCWVFGERPGDAPKQVIRDLAKIGPTGQCVDKRGWYAWSGATSGCLFNWRVYNRGGNPCMWTPTGTTLSGSNQAGLAYLQGQGGYATLRRYDTNSTYDGVPNVMSWGFGQDGGVEILDPDANFEWLYGLNAAIKAAVPKFLGFEDSYDSQFLYYLYDTSYPWNGPIFGIQYRLNDKPCCPNATCPDTATTGGGAGGTRQRPCCKPNYHNYSHFYQIREDSWETTRTKIKLTNKSTQGVNESFWTFDTTTPRILFRYLTRDGDFNRGEKLNGWDIVSVFYFGDELKCGMMELSGDGNDFTYEQQFTSDDGAEMKVLAGPGMGDKCAFAGVYEFPKKVSYYKVELSPRALVPNRTLDAAKLKAIVDDEGAISEIEIINHGRGYHDGSKVIEPDGSESYPKARISVVCPKVMEDFSPTDVTEHLEDLISEDTDYEKAIGFTESIGTGEDPVREVQLASGAREGIIKFPTNHDESAGKIRTAKLEISKFDRNGGIEEVRVIDGGAGYSQKEPPQVFVSDPEYIEYTGPDKGEKELDQTTANIDDAFQYINTSSQGARFGTYQPPKAGAGINAVGTFTTSTFDNGAKNFEIPLSADSAANGGANFANMNMAQIAKMGIDQIKSPQQALAPDSYIRIAQVDEENQTKLCFDLPPNCLDVTGRGNVLDALPKEDFFSEVSKINEPIRDYEAQIMPELYSAAIQVDKYQETTSHVYGGFNKQRCITVGQPKLISIGRWFDMPCAYMSTTEAGSTILDEIQASRKLTEERAFGYLPYKYCASDTQEAEFVVGIQIEGRTIGSMGDDFMDYLDTFNKPKLTPSRKLPENNGHTNAQGYRTWGCSRGGNKGRCYRDPNDEDDIIFVPVGLEENTFDYNRSGYDEGEQFALWLGDNLTGYDKDAQENTWSWIYQTEETGPPDPETGESTTTTVDNPDAETTGAWTAIEIDCPDGNVPQHDCWDKYVRLNGAPSDAPLDVYCGWDDQGNGISGKRFWEITGPGNSGWNQEGHDDFSEGYSGDGTGVYNPMCNECAAGNTWGSFLSFAYGLNNNTNPAVGLEYVADASIAIDPSRIDSPKGESYKVMHMGPYNGTMRVRNWLTGSIQALSNAIDNYGNPYFTECDVARPDTTRTRKINEDL